MTIWILESGRYSGRYVLGVFSSRENAMRVKERRNDEDDHDPREIEVDEVIEWEVGVSFAASIRLESGDINPDYTLFSERSRPHERHPRKCVVEEDDAEITVISPISYEHAVKVATERRQERLRDRALVAIREGDRVLRVTAWEGDRLINPEGGERR